AQRQLLLGCSQSYPQIVWATATGLCITPFAPGAGAPTQEARADCRSTALGAKGEARTPSQPLFAPGAGAPTGEARVECRSTALGAKGEARAPSQPLFAPGAGAPTQEARADCRSTAPGAKGEARAPSQPLFAPGAGAPTGEACVDCRSTAPGAKGKPKHRVGPCSHPGRVLLLEQHPQRFIQAGDGNHLHALGGLLGGVGLGHYGAGKAMLGCLLQALLTAGYR